MIRVMIADDHPIVRQGVRSLLSNCADMTLVGEAADAAAAVALAGRLQPDVILLDLRMPGAVGMDVARAVLRQAPRSRVLVLSSFDDDEYVSQALQAGVHGYILKSASDDMLVGAVRAAHRGERVLSPSVVSQVVEQFAELSRERVWRELGLTEEEARVLQLLAAGASNPKIAVELFLSETTVKRKLQDIFEKLGVTTRAQAAAEAARRGLV